MLPEGRCCCGHVSGISAFLVDQSGPQFGQSTAIPISLLPLQRDHANDHEPTCSHDIVTRFRSDVQSVLTRVSPRDGVATFTKRMGVQHPVPQAEHAETGARPEGLSFAIVLEPMACKARQLRKLAVTRSNQVWAMDNTYSPMARSFVYLVAVLD